MKRFSAYLIGGEDDESGIWLLHILSMFLWLENFHTKIHLKFSQNFTWNSSRYQFLQMSTNIKILLRKLTLLFTDEPISLSSIHTKIVFRSPRMITTNFRANTSAQLYLYETDSDRKLDGNYGIGASWKLGLISPIACHENIFQRSWREFATASRQSAYFGNHATEGRDKW